MAVSTISGYFIALKTPDHTLYQKAALLSIIQEGFTIAISDNLLLTILIKSQQDAGKTSNL